MSRIDYKKLHDDLFIEMLDVFINSILYLRDVYPSEIFRRRRIYSTAIYASIYPPLNDYIRDVLKTILELKEQQKLRRVELVIYKVEPTLFDDDEEEEILEKFIIYMKPDGDTKRSDQMDLGEYLLKFEEQLRRAIAQLNHSMKNMKPLNSDECSFRIELETTEAAYVNLVSKINSQPKDFSWIQSDEEETKAYESRNWRFMSIIKNDQFNIMFQKRS